MAAQSERSGEKLGDAKRDFSAPVLQEPFEWLACWALVLAFPIGIVVVAAEALDTKLSERKARRTPYTALRSPLRPALGADGRRSGGLALGFRIHSG
jgi:hypothetical protein